MGVSVDEVDGADAAGAPNEKVDLGASAAGDAGVADPKLNPPLAGFVSAGFEAGAPKEKGFDIGSSTFGVSAVGAVAPKLKEGASFLTAASGAGLESENEKPLEAAAAGSDGLPN